MTIRARIAFLSVTTVLAAAASAQPAADTLPPSPPPPKDGDATLNKAPEITTGEDPWRVDVDLWAWIMGVDGDIGAKGQTVEAGASFIDIMDASDSIFAFSGRVEVGYDRFGMYVDGLFADITVEDQTGPSSLGDVDVEFEQTLLDFGLMYRLYDEKPSGKPGLNELHTTFDLYAGGRYSGLDLELRPELEADRSQSKDWIDPIIGGKLVFPFAERWHMELSADVGGFGVSSDFTWGTTAVIGYDFHIADCPAAVLAGYRAIGWDYSDGEGDQEFTWDVINHGILFGLEIGF